VKFSDESSTAINGHESDALTSRSVVRTNWNNEEGFDTLYPDEKSSTISPVTLKGSIETLIPKATLKFTFTNNETGDAKEQNGIKVKLTSIKGRAVSVYAKSTEGRYLKKITSIDFARGTSQNAASIQTDYYCGRPLCLNVISRQEKSWLIITLSCI
jgi:hypothetical protein